MAFLSTEGTAEREVDEEDAPGLDMVRDVDSVALDAPEDVDSTSLLGSSSSESLSS